MSINLYIVRHGETYINKYKRIQGWTNAPLTEKGIQDGKSAGKRLQNIKFNNAYSSDLERATTTAEIVLNQNKHTDSELLQPLPELREQFFGYFDGIPNTIAAQAIAKNRSLPENSTFANLTSELGPFEIINAIHEADPTGDAETADLFWQRLMTGFRKISKENNDNDNVLLVSHGRLLSTLGQHFAQLDGDQAEPDNGAVSIWHLDDDQLELHVFNDLKTIW
ncbi:histidine phosphatase family protein [Weissella paramesenteroides]|uniref:histidine phosphatase family protein n=1 Tax=Weissella paramesenteroides TaxID=1249 RepID=UPI00223BBCFC|nr:histidine phosphatase family protein [Weissella paramesenteroides]MCT0485502.1 histidine phosphatase family protein [Weissella paramesenteroides]